MDINNELSTFDYGESIQELNRIKTRSSLTNGRVSSVYITIDKDTGEILSSSSTSKSASNRFNSEMRCGLNQLEKLTKQRARLRKMLESK